MEEPNVHRLSAIFAKGGSERKVTVLNIVASNATLNGGKARLNLRPAFALLPKMGPRSKWLGIIRDVRTALKDNPLPVDVLKGLVAELA